MKRREEVEITGRQCSGFETQRAQRAQRKKEKIRTRMRQNR
jgi:hypothetical protein